MVISLPFLYMISPHLIGTNQAILLASFNDDTQSLNNDSIFSNVSFLTFINLNSQSNIHESLNQS
ncbi:MAG: hypothetical protein PF569_04680 [Candidatus Woesearchaeota archaeon]|nr:hypothetical protein [Candidatus Woesearchaeota archaeon]